MATQCDFSALSIEPDGDFSAQNAMSWHSSLARTTDRGRQKRAPIPHCREYNRRNMFDLLKESF